MYSHPISKSVLPLIFCTRLFSGEVVFVATPFTDVNSFTAEIEGPACDRAGNVYARWHQVETNGARSRGTLSIQFSACSLPWFAGTQRECVPTSSAITIGFKSPNRALSASRVVFTRNSSITSPFSPRQHHWLHSSPRSIPTVSFIFRLLACSAFRRVSSLLFFFMGWLLL